MRKKSGIIFLMSFIFFQLWNLPLSVQAAGSLDTESIDEFVTSYIERNGLPGAAIVVVNDGEIVYENGYGHDSNGEPLTEKSLMRIASVLD